MPDFSSDFGPDFNVGGVVTPVIGTAKVINTASAGASPGMTTLLLDTVAWDLVVDANANIALAAAPYATAQDAASAIRLFLGELWYDTTQGVNYWDDILGQSPPLSLIKSDLVTAAMTVPDVASAAVFISAINNRTISGQVQGTSRSTGLTFVASFSVTPPPGGSA